MVHGLADVAFGGGYLTAGGDEPFEIVRNPGDDDDRNAWHGRRGDHPIYYIDIKHYISIIQSRWSDFEDLFPDHEMLQLELEKRLL